MRLSESLKSSKVGSYQQGVMIGDDSCGFVDHMNEDDDKLKTFTIQEENQKMHSDDWGIRVFLPDNQVKASAHDENATTIEGQPALTVMMKEKISKSAQGEEEEHSTEWLKIFSQEVETEMTAALELVEAERKQMT
jgi:hypothetical protein